MNRLKQLLVVLGLSVVGVIALVPARAFAHGGHGGGFHAAPAFHGGGFHAAPAFRGGVPFRAAPVFHGAPGPVYRGGFHGVVAPRVMVGPRHYGPPVVRVARTWVPGYWGWNRGVRVWIGGAFVTPPSPGWTWVAAHWSWNGVQWVWQGGYWAPPVY